MANLPKPPVGAIYASFRQFAQTEVFGAVILLITTIVALIWANSPWHHAYEQLWHHVLTLGTTRLQMTESLHIWVNDGLMVLFFLVVGLEIKRELTVGELSSRSAALLPTCAALGGAVIPAGIYLAINLGHPGERGWGIPMATDIAFALGVLALLGSAIPPALKVFLGALAIVDDLLAVMVIAFVYTSRIDWAALSLAAAIVVVLVAINRLGVRLLWVYGLLGIVLWVAVFQSGVHATIAGVLLAFTIPAGSTIAPESFVRKARQTLVPFEKQPAGTGLQTDAQFEALEELEHLVGQASSPALRLEHMLHPLVSFAIVPLFALANAGIRWQGTVQAMLGNRIAIGIILGLVLGKVIGIQLGVWLPMRFGLVRLSEGLRPDLIFAVSWLGGIGFTMSIFVSDLAFPGDNVADLRRSAQLAIVIASAIAGGIGYMMLRRSLFSRRALVVGR